MLFRQRRRGVIKAAPIDRVIPFCLRGENFPPLTSSAKCHDFLPHYNRKMRRLLQQAKMNAFLHKSVLLARCALPTIIFQTPVN
jgi:hypothetical protein